MATDMNSAEPTTLPAVRTDLAALIKRHQLVAFFVMAYAFAWLLWIPLLVLSRNGLGLLPFKAPAILLAVIGGFAPGLAAILVTAVVEGGPGVWLLLRRCIQWRVGVWWYLAAIFLVPIGFLVASVLLGAISYRAALGNWPLLFSFYPAVLVAQVLLGGGLGEEPGWRGFALPRMQSKFGPLWASVLLGILHVCWHIPLFFVSDLTQAHFNFVLYGLVGICMSILLTSLYNATGGSLLLVMLLHEAEDTTSALSLRIAPGFLDRTPAYLLVYAALALAILLLTRGSLLYKRTDAPQMVDRAGIAEDTL